MTKKENFRVLGIETSCDETAVAIVDSERNIIAHRVLSQDAHKIYGGVVPEIASRAHMEHLDLLVEKTMEDAKMQFSELDAVAATAGPGLIGGLIVGLMSGKAIAASIDRPFIAVNHLEGHALTARLVDESLKFPYLMLLISGGHCQILVARDVGDYELLGQTLDDALGEAFDKLAKMLELGYPGGPIIEKMAKEGDDGRFELPMPLVGQKNCNFSFSGLKTALRNVIIGLKEEKGEVTEQDKKDLCASFQKVVAKILCNRLEFAIEHFKERYEGEKLVVAGGVAANQFLKQALEDLARKNSLELACPPIKLCTDNAAMIAWAGVEKFRKNDFSGLDFEPRSRWPLSEN